MPKLIDRQGQLVSAPTALSWLTLEQWQAVDATAARAAGTPIGLEFQPADQPGLVAQDLPRFAALAVRFPKFTDGRGLTIAQRLRHRYGWQGPLWAVGEILRDQLFAYGRVGFDHFALRDDEDLDAARSALHDYAVRYQGAWDEPRPLWRRVERAGALR